MKFETFRPFYGLILTVFQDLMGSSMTTSLENPLSSLSSGYFSDSTTFKVKPTIEDIQGRCSYRVFEKKFYLKVAFI